MLATPLPPRNMLCSVEQRAQLRAWRGAVSGWGLSTRDGHFFSKSAWKRSVSGIAKLEGARKPFANPSPHLCQPFATFRQTCANPLPSFSVNPSITRLETQVCGFLALAEWILSSLFSLCGGGSYRGIDHGLNSERAKGAEKAPCGETVVQKGAFAKIKTPENLRTLLRNVAVHFRVLGDRFSAQRRLRSFSAPPALLCNNQCFFRPFLPVLQRRVRGPPSSPKFCRTFGDPQEGSV